MAQPNDVKQILGDIGGGDAGAGQRRKDAKLKEKKKRPGRYWKTICDQNKFLFARTPELTPLYREGK